MTWVAALILVSVAFSIGFVIGAAWCGIFRRTPMTETTPALAKATPHKEPAS